MKRLSPLVLIALGFAGCENPTKPAENSGSSASVAPAATRTFRVTSAADAVDAQPGDGVRRTAAGTCTLRAAIQEANALAGVEAITLPAGTYRLTRVGPRNGGITGGDLDITGPVQITGAGAATTAVDGSALTVPPGELRSLSIFQVANSGSGRVEMARLRLHGARPCDGNGSAVQVLAGATAVLRQIAVQDNHDACGGTAAISNAGTLRLDQSVVTGNSGNGTGGILNTGTLTILRSTLSDNEADDAGGAVTNLGTLTMLNSTLSGNYSANGVGGIFNNRGTVTLNNVTLTRNRNGAVTNYAPGVIRLGNTIVSGNTAGESPDDCSGNATLTSEGYNLIGTDCTVVGNQTGNRRTNVPGLGPLQNNGGPTPTHALLAGSPAINAANPAEPGSGYPACPPLDQRLRPRGATRCDIGAFEVQ